MLNAQVTTMLTLLIERLIELLTNHCAGRSTSRQAGNASGSKPAASRQSDSRSDLAPIVLGTTLPSARDALRQGTGNAEPLAVTLSVEERRRHVYLLGATGTGKTNSLIQLLSADVEAGRGVVLVDARGDLVDRALVRLAHRFDPETLAERLVLLDLRSQPPFTDAAQQAPVVGFNPLGDSGVDDPYARAFFLFDVLAQHADLGVQTAEVMRNSLLALAMTGWTCLEVEPLLTLPAFRRQVVERVTDPSVTRFFARFESLPDSQKQQWISPVTNKLSPFLSRPSLRHVLGQRDSAVSFRLLFTDRPDAIVLVCAAADELFQSGHLVSSLITNAVAGALMRSERTEAERQKTTFMYLDEFENFGDSSKQFEAIISEGRRFGLGLTLSHQATTQLEPKLRNLIRNVVGTQMFFAVGGLDADQLAGEIPSDMPKPALRNLLISQQIGEALLIRRGQAPQRLRTPHSPDPQVAIERVTAVRQASLTRWGQPACAIEQEFQEREKLFAGAVSPVPVRRAPHAAPVNAPDKVAPAFEVREAAEPASPAPPRRRKKQNASKGETLS